MRETQAASVSPNLNVVAVRSRLIVVQRLPSAITYAAAALLSHFSSRVAARFPPLDSSLSASRQPFKTPTVAFVNGNQQRRTPFVTGCNFRQSSLTGEGPKTVQVFLRIRRPRVKLSLSLSIYLFLSISFPVRLSLLHSLCPIPALFAIALLNCSFHHLMVINAINAKKKYDSL